MAAMPGLMNSTALTPPAPPPPSGDGAPAPGIQQADDSEGQQASPQEQAEYDQFLGQVRKLLYENKAVTQATIQSLKSGDPISALAHAALTAVQRVEAAAGQAGQKIDPGVLLHGGQEVVQDIADFSNQVATAQGTPTYSDKQIQQAYLMAVDLYRQGQQKMGGVDQGAAQQDWTQALDADQKGDIDKVVPGATEAAKAMAPAAAAATAAQNHPIAANAGAAAGAKARQKGNVGPKKPKRK